MLLMMGHWRTRLAAVNLRKLCNWVDLNEYNVQLFLIMKLKTKKKIPASSLFKTKKVSNKCQKCNSFDNPTLQNKKVEWVLASSTISLLLHYTKDLKVNKDLKIFF